MIVGQKHLVEDLLIGLLADGHLLLEGMPGLAKTLAISTLADIIDAKFNRIQFTPDLLPLKIQAEGKQKRADAEKELVVIENQLKEKMLEASKGR